MYEHNDLLTVVREAIRQVVVTRGQPYYTDDRLLEQAIDSAARHAITALYAPMTRIMD